MSPEGRSGEPKSEAQTLSCEEGSAPLNHPHLGDLLEKFCERTMDFDLGEDFIDHLEAGAPLRPRRHGQSFPAAAGFNTYSPSPTEHTERTLIWRHIRASTGSKFSFSYLADYAQSVGLDGTKLAQIITDLIHLGHVALTDEGHQSGFSFTALL